MECAEERIAQIVQQNAIEIIAWDVDGTLVVDDDGMHAHKGRFEHQVKHAARLKKLLRERRCGAAVRHIIMSRNYNFNSSTDYHSQVKDFGFDDSVPDLYRACDTAKRIKGKRVLLIDDSKEECALSAQAGCVTIWLQGRGGVFSAMDSGEFEVVVPVTLHPTTTTTTTVEFEATPPQFIV